MALITMDQPKAPLKRLKDYPLKVWQPAADTCEFCGAPYQVQVSWVDETGNFGTVIFKADHKPDCQRDMGDQTEEDVAGWLFSENTVHLFAKEWTPIKARANVGPCLNCWRLIVGTPIILFLQEGKAGEIDVCVKCAEETGILKALIRRTKK